MNVEEAAKLSENCFVVFIIKQDISLSDRSYTTGEELYIIEPSMEISSGSEVVFLDHLSRKVAVRKNGGRAVVGFMPKELEKEDLFGVRCIPIFRYSRLPAASYK